jgi:hypothetical protein
MKKLYLFCILLVATLIACDFGSNPQNNNTQENEPSGCSEQDSSEMLFVAIWICNDTMFYLDSPEYNRTLDDTVIHFASKDEHGLWVHFPYAGGQGLPVYNVTNSSFETNWLGGDMVTVHYELESFDAVGSNHITITHPGYEKTFSLYTE